MLGKLKAKYIQSLGQKKQRDAEGRFVAEGPKIVDDLLSSVPGMIEEIYSLPEWKSQHSIPPAVEHIEVSPNELERISQLKTPNQVLAVLRKLNEDTTPVIAGKVSLLLDTIQDPGNLGTIIRIADWFNISQIICSPDCADVYNPKVIQSSMGSIARIQVFYGDVIELLGENRNVPVYAMMLDGDDVSSFKQITEGIIIIGNESKGIQPAIAQYASKKITIPRKGGAESLNAAVATGIVLSRLV